MTIVDRRTFLIACGALALGPRASAFSGTEVPLYLPYPPYLPYLPGAGLAQGTRPVAAPADAWPQFRGLPSLTGVSATAIPAAPKLAWAWEGGEAFDSSAAIVDGVVYVGTATGELIAVGLADGKLRWRYQAGESIGESSPAVVGGRVFIGDLLGVVHAVGIADG
ncbi:MAG TPA: PQQ-binding-like beta-propeller repeat protein, partial [Rhodospirillales bacterium]